MVVTFFERLQRRTICSVYFEYFLPRVPCSVSPEGFDVCRSFVHFRSGGMPADRGMRACVFARYKAHPTKTSRLLYEMKQTEEFVAQYQYTRRTTLSIETCVMEGVLFRHVACFLAAWLSLECAQMNNGCLGKRCRLQTTEFDSLQSDHVRQQLVHFERSRERF